MFVSRIGITNENTIRINFGTGKEYDEIDEMEMK